MKSKRATLQTFLNCVGNSSVQVLTVNQALNLWSSSQKVTILPSSQTYDLRPYSSTTMDVGQNQVFTATAYGGTSPYTYQWYQSGSEVGTNSTSYEFDPSSVGSFLLNVNTTDSSSVPVTVESNLDSITVNSALVAPIVSVDHGTVDQGQTSSLTSTVLRRVAVHTLISGLRWRLAVLIRRSAVRLPLVILLLLRVLRLLDLGVLKFKLLIVPVPLLRLLLFRFLLR